jgi:hypothetical protein
LDVVTDDKMRGQDWGWARLVSITPTTEGRVKILVEYDTDPHQLADIAALMLRHAANEVRRPGARTRRPRGPGD